MKTPKLIVSLLTVLMLGLFLGGASAQDTTLTWWDYFNADNLNEAIQDMIADYEAAHPGVTIERTPIGFGDLKARIIQGAATGTLPDILIVDNPDNQALAAQGALADISDYVADWEYKDAYFEGPWASTIYQGANYGVPFDSNATALYYNIDLLNEAGFDAPPATWDELREMAAALTEGDQAGFCLSLVATEEGTFTYLPFLWGNGGDLQNIGGEANVEALTLLNAMMNEDNSIPRAALQWGQGDANNQFLAGKCAMMINGPWQLPGIRAAAPEFEWDVAAWPDAGTPTSILGGQNFAIGAGANMDAAWDVIEWATQPENLLKMYETSGFITNREDLADAEVFTSDPMIAKFVEAVSVAKPRAYGPNYPQVSQEVMNMVQSVLVGGKTPEVAAADAAAVIDPLLSE